MPFHERRRVNSKVILVKVAALLTDEKGWNTVGWIVAAVFLPLILIAAFLCSAASGGADHNNLAVEASFYGICSGLPVKTTGTCRVTA